MKKGIITLLCVTIMTLSLVGCGSKADVNKGIEIEKATVDSISKASTKNFYEQSSLKGQKLVDAVNARSGSFTFATTNKDGSPNLAVFGFGMIDEKYAMAGISQNQTLENLKRNKIGVVSFYQYNASAADKLERNKGARLVIKIVEDKAKIEELKKKTEGKSNESTIFFEIVETKALG
ncbi:pyridoxamine 5'-phosphate oxidase family protein [Clostridium swellfunianum]|uniref:pyridoxamine 5'-phosphate oxidase family protein n=1 Tax=Clostridium swellfunianum TaxID=1367462 RepID=UPI002030FB48|nr:pyridoxamine 5'-phosphate oxidase family protein [Clostridium swellfunianum]MCM0651007.1 pyridoxamine 5'-phosphate oxidase family protein [Clostridium swellfunianum]